MQIYHVKTISENILPKHWTLLHRERDMVIMKYKIKAKMDIGCIDFESSTLHLYIQLLYKLRVLTNHRL